MLVGDTTQDVAIRRTFAKDHSNSTQKWTEMVQNLCKNVKGLEETINLQREEVIDMVQTELERTRLKWDWKKQDRQHFEGTNKARAQYHFEGTYEGS
ncbi:hypothetical protein scyTo_0007575 [Scyliorhinus torazame]|uniref:Uncharacterized protein n=1 Tax=Scyliorhinus torazame TaxID=75743 RepID=A0A401NV17_SCYTO|nr:hypothetical protein [Scyliorhinus torazame]